VESQVPDELPNKALLPIPERMVFRGRILGADMSCLHRLKESVEVTISPLSVGKVQGFRAETLSGESIAIVGQNTTQTLGCDAVIQVPDISTIEIVQAALEGGAATWLHPRTKRAISLDRDVCGDLVDQVRKSWKSKFVLKSEEVDEHSILSPGLRAPQVGAVHAVYAHWSVSDAPATIVMPTGTGKTETMLALLVSVPLERVLVVVPNDALRTQVARKFLTLGVLKESSCLERDARYPVVARLKSGPRTVSEVDEIFLRSNVVVSTMQLVAQAPADVQERMAELVTALIVDEAHHISARTWIAARAHFKKKRVLQFTATPFRNDGRRVDGRFIYVYPLWKAQEQKLFKPITFVPVYGLDREDADEKIIEEVGRVVAEDERNGYRHLVMARADSILRATTLQEKYLRALPKLNPVLIHSDLPKAVRDASLQRLIKRDSRIAICVDMLGEGFDLPELKIAALHDKQRSEAVTFQFVGRFTRTRSDLGNATVIANIVGGDVKDSLRSLYAEDADWNRVLNVVGSARTAREVRREEVFTGFSDVPERFPLETLFPRMSTVAYKTACTTWSPDRLDTLFKAGSIVEGPYVNEAERLAIFVRRDEERLRWTTVKEPQNIEYNLFMVHWDDDRGLLFVNSSNLGDLHQDIADAVTGGITERITGERVFRVLDGFRRLVLMNLGLSETQRKPIRYSSFMGSDIAEQLETLPGNRNRTKTNIFGQGYTDEGKSTIGCSVKGKVWSYDVTNNFGDWIAWCHDIGRKLLDETITTENILRRLVRPKKQAALPAKPPIAIAWPEGFLHIQEDRVDIEIDGIKVPFFDCDIRLLREQPADRITFGVGSDAQSAIFQMTIDASGAHYIQASGPEVIVHIRSRSYLLRDRFKEDPPHIYFADGDMLVDQELFVLPVYEDRVPYDVQKITGLDWSAVDIRTESRGVEENDKSVQGFMIKRLLAGGADYDVIFDDDGSGEVADIVALRLSGQTLKVDLFHCKFSSGDSGGARVGDLYEVCGQAQKSIRWRERPDIFLAHLQRREATRQRGGRPSRYVHGKAATVNGWLNRWQDFSYDFSITVVQPGYRKAEARPEHLELFAATESLLMDTWGMKFAVIAAE
jgi:superfamily II DNA or RNA helicase